MGIALLGPLDVDGSRAALGARDRVVLAALAMGPRRTLTAEQLADAVWGASPPASWRKNLQSCIVRLRRVLGADAIVTTPQGYRLAVPHDDVDADLFERLVARGQELLTLGETERAAYTLERALALWRGPPLAELEEWEPGRIEAERLEELRCEAEEHWVDASLRSGHHGEVLAQAQAMVRASPLRERRWQLLALAEYQCGRQGEALQTLADLRRMLAQELGIDPDPGSADLEQAILRHDPVLDVHPAATAASDRSPYPGLSAYDVADAEAFFGRERDISACLDRLRTTGVLAVVGPSGTGKSSLVRAGVAASLRREGYDVEVVTPGPRPLDALPARGRPRRRSVLVVDQCEEVFTLCDDPAARTAFLDRVVARAGSPGDPGLVVALRADRTGDLTTHQACGRLVERGLYLLASMREDDLRAAIEGPARQAGLVVEPGLVDLLLREVEGEPAALPLLSHSLRETWLRREGRSLTVAGYRASGGIREAVARTAEDVYTRLDVHQRDPLRDLLRRLVAPGPDGQPVLSRVPLRLVTADPVQAAIVDTLIRSRILSSDEVSVALTHEAIVRAWPRLRRWLDEDLEGRRILHHLAGAADAWDRLGRPASDLYRGARLQQALEWCGRERPELAPAERDFLESGWRLAETEEQSELRQAREQSRMIHRLRLVLAGALVLLLAALAATVYAAHQGRVADRSASRARAAEVDAVARGAGANALVTRDVDESLLLAVAGVRLDDSVDTRNSLLAAIGRYPALFASTPMPGQAQVLRLDVSPDGERVATMDDRHRVRLFDVDSGALLAQRQAGVELADATVRERLLAFSPGGRTLAVGLTATRGPSVELLDARTLRPQGAGLAGAGTQGWLVTDLSFSQDGRHLAAGVRRVGAAGSGSGAPSAAALVWDLRRGGGPATVDLHGASWQSVALSPDGRVLYTTTPLVRHDLVGGGSRVLGASGLDNLSMSPDGRLLAGVEGGHAVLRDGRSGRLVTRLRSGLDVAQVRFSTDGRRLALVEWNERQVEIWQVAADRPRRLTTVALDRGSFRAVDFSGDASYLVSTSGASTLRRWDLTGQRHYVRRGSQPDRRVLGGFGDVAPDGEREVFLPFEGGGFGFRDLESGAETRVVPWGEGFRHTLGTWHPDGIHYATAVGDRLRVWDVRSARRVDGARLPSRRVTEIDYTPDGSRLAVAELSGRVSMLATSTWEPVGRPVEVGEPVSWVQVAPDDRTAVVLTGGPSGNDLWIDAASGWAVLDLEQGRVVRRGDLGFADTSWLGLSPDGRYAAITGGSPAERLDPTGTDGRLAVIDLRTGRLVRTPVVAHAGAAWQLDYSPDGSRIVTAGLDGTVALWDAEAGTLLSRVEIEGRPFVGVAFLPDGRSARAVEWGTGRTWIWDLSARSALYYACRAAGRELTLEEWREHFGDRPYERVCES
ncbi:hypothetical protein GCM10009844_30330 [Nocardioides koreensis]|uniref:OmpR/PhoB-type domain-containing protein n=1 Tax=Nocardioides koreensis TaxID=433651 RepID=A0ABN2ZY23_9ACTN